MIVSCAQNVRINDPRFTFYWEPRARRRAEQNSRLIFINELRHNGGTTTVRNGVPRNSATSRRTNHFHGHILQAAAEQQHTATTGVSQAADVRLWLFRDLEIHFTSPPREPDSDFQAAPPPTSKKKPKTNLNQVQHCKHFEMFDGFSVTWIFMKYMSKNITIGDLFVNMKNVYPI